MTKRAPTVRSLPFLLCCALLAGAVIVPGCGGGASPTSNTGTGLSRFRGSYSGTFTGTLSLQTTSMGGTFTATANEGGALTGTLTQPGFGTFQAIGTISSGGNFILTASLPQNQVTLNGNVNTGANPFGVAGTISVPFGVATRITGAFTGTRTGN